MAVRRIVDSRGEPDEHADPISFSVARQQFAGDAGRHFFPFPFQPLPRRRHRRFLASLRRDAAHELSPERWRGAQYVGRPGDEEIDDWTQHLHLLPAFWTY